ncbi:DNA-binding response regulator, OmpR family, contains REC and winged-helix (wHTH) domain [Caloramator quimbayensis]|uniref:Stage 0 sporulation protein A homolog n=1 Tax=Caloramator quimbayensis TaxID=1147123 RepID=A0A1T4XT37_9CLOT|nr:response regulator transcription factor [Caloramator quimbayensis]SKA92700.1 DNA-binding response regulator, OmpR family, contains REC and winged-helix (wHTH) domain [Caloramator quimbayensis]
MNIKILVVEDEATIRKFIKINLERENFKVTEAASGEEALDKIQEFDIDVAVLDVMLPKIDGFEVCRILRKKNPKIGIIILTARGQDIDKITGLECGADDYMVKPFNPIELILRIKAILRRMDEKFDEEEIITYGPFRIESYSKKVYKNDIEIEMTPTEYSIIKLFMQNPNKAFSRDEILNKVWGYDFIGDTKIVDVNIRRIRTKIEDNPAEPHYIETVWGIGYRFKNR